MADKINIQSEDKDIIESFNSGNKSAFNLIVLKYQKRIYWLVRKFVLDHDDSDDITQEVFLKLYKSLPDFRGESALFTYIYKIAVNYSLNHIKKNKVLSNYKKDFDTEVFKIKSDEPNSDELMDRNFDANMIKEAIQILPEKQRAVFTLRFYEELPYEEIATVLGTSVGGLKANYFHAFKKIQSYITEKKVKYKNMGYLKEELLENLPDYINNKIEDDKLKDTIEMEILSNPEFKKEYDLIFNTLKSINNVEFSEPPVNYFNSLLPRINERINEKSVSHNILKRFASYWKYAVPVATIILFFIGYKTIFKNNEYINHINRDSETVLKEYNYSDVKNADTSLKSEEKTTTENMENLETTETTNNSENVNTNIKVTGKTKKSNNEEQINAFIEFTENSSEEEIFLNDDDLNYEQDFENLSSEEQNDLLSKISNSNL